MKLTKHPLTLLTTIFALWFGLGPIVVAQTLPAASDIKIDIAIEPNKSDNSLVNIEGKINNRGNRSRYIYYIVAKAFVGETAIKQTIVPVNVEIAPGETKAFKHPISKESLKQHSLQQVEPVVVKYESRPEAK
jgi:hypothetical protein